MCPPSQPMVVAASTGTRRTGPQRIKIFVGNVSPHTTTQELRSLFQSYGNVVEADILSNYAFVVRTWDSGGGRGTEESVCQCVCMCVCLELWFIASYNDEQKTLALMDQSYPFSDT